MLCVDTLPYLLQACFVLDQGLVSLLLQLIHTALSGIPAAKPESKDAVIAAVLAGHKKKGGAAKEEEKAKKEQKAKEGKEKAKSGEISTIAIKRILSVFMLSCLSSLHIFSSSLSLFFFPPPSPISLSLSYLTQPSLTKKCAQLLSRCSYHLWTIRP